jgi:hypothetical protein
VTRRWQWILPVLLGTAIGAVFVGFLVYAAARGDPRDLLARWVRAMSLTPLTGALVGACLGAAIGGVVAWLTVKHAADVAELGRELNFSFADEVPAEALSTINRTFPGLGFSFPRNWMAGTHDDLQVGMMDCTVFEKNGLAPAGTHVRKTLVFVFGDSPKATSFEIRPQGPVFGWPFSLLLAGLRRLGAAFDSGPPDVRRFRKNYDLLWLGRPADADIIRRLLGAEALSFFAEHAGWSLVVEQGSLAAWQDGLSESDARERRAMMHNAVDFHRWLNAAATTAKREGPHQPELVRQ